MKQLSTLKSYLYLVLFAILVSSCECYEDPGIVINESRELAEFDIFAPTFILIEQNDVAQIICNDGFTAGELSIIQNDVGDIHLFNLNVEDLFIELNDVGDVELTGMANNITASLDGVGELHLFDLICKSAEVDLRGTGDIEIRIVV